MTAPDKPSTEECEFCGRETYASRIHRAPAVTTEEIATTCLGPRGLVPGLCLDATRARLATLASDNAWLRERVKAADRCVNALRDLKPRARFAMNPAYSAIAEAEAALDAYDKAKDKFEAAREERKSC